MLSFAFLGGRHGGVQLACAGVNLLELALENGLSGDKLQGSC